MPEKKAAILLLVVFLVVMDWKILSSHDHCWATDELGLSKTSLWWYATAFTCTHMRAHTHTHTHTQVSLYCTHGCFSYQLAPTVWNQLTVLVCQFFQIFLGEHFSFQKSTCTFNFFLMGKCLGPVWVGCCKYLLHYYYYWYRAWKLCGHVTWGTESKRLQGSH